MANHDGSNVVLKFYLGNQNAVIWVFPWISQRRGGTAEHTQGTAICGKQQNDDTVEMKYQNIYNFQPARNTQRGRDEYLKTIDGISFSITAYNVQLSP